MLSIAVARSADYYARLAQVGYYTAAPEKPGAWYGKGAERLLFTVEINDLSAFKKVFEGLHPEGGKLVQNAGKENRKNAWDLTFSAPKSFSVLWAIANETDRKVLETIERRAVESALNEATNHVVTRTGKGGVIREQCDVIFALFPHSASRAEEPQRHTHCLLMNIGVRANGRTSALETADLFRMKMTLGALYRAELSRLMEHEYGISFERVKNSIELLGRDKTLCEFYSTRSKEIEGFMKENGLKGATLAAKACTETRSKKDMEKGIDEHLSRWLREAGEQGMTYEKLFGEMKRAHLAQQAPQSQLKQSAEERKAAVLAGLIDTVNERLFKEHSHFSQFRLFQTVAEESQLLSLTLEEIRSVKTTIQKSLIFLHRERNGVEHYTTARTLNQEKSLIVNAEKLAEDGAHVVRAQVRKECLSSKLSDEQKLAFLHVTEPGRLKIVEGLAGTGKTTFLREANRAWVKEGYTTIGISLAAIAAENLKTEAGIQDAKSLAKFFIEHEKGTVQVDRKTVIVLDEAAMVGTHDLKKLTDICLATGAKTVWVGDRSQLQSIAPGGGFAGAADRFGKAELNEIWRQQGAHEWGRKAVYDAAKGAVTDTLAKLNEEGKLVELNH
jgi:conjugative relaxase-like TrwC/TraI family protein